MQHHLLCANGDACAQNNKYIEANSGAGGPAPRDSAARSPGAPGRDPAKAVRTAGRPPLLAGLLVLGASCAAPPALATTWDVNDYVSLSNALTSAVSGDTIVFTSNIMWAGTDLPAIMTNLTIEGAGYTLDAGASRGFLAYSGTSSISDLTITGGVAHGGAGGSGDFGGGGGAGLGGGLFVATGATVTTSNLQIVNNQAAGGAGGSYFSSGSGTYAYGGGGGLGGPGGGTDYGGGGGVGELAYGGWFVPDGFKGIINGAAPGGNGFGPANSSDVSGVGGSDGGGGGSGTEGGGGGGVAGGQGAFVPDGGWGGGGGGSQGGAGGFGGGAGGYSGGGGGGAGMGGGIFVEEGGTLVLGSGTVSGNSVTAGTGGFGAESGSAYGAGLFLQGTGTLTLAPAAGTTETISDTIADQTGVGGTGRNSGQWGLTLQPGNPGARGGQYVLRPDRRQRGDAERDRLRRPLRRTGRRRCHGEQRDARHRRHDADRQLADHNQRDVHPDGRDADRFVGQYGARQRGNNRGLRNDQQRGRRLYGQPGADRGGHGRDADVRKHGIGIWLLRFGRLARQHGDDRSQRRHAGHGRVLHDRQSAWRSRHRKRDDQRLVRQRGRRRSARRHRPDDHRFRLFHERRPRAAQRLLLHPEGRRDPEQRRNRGVWPDQRRDLQFRIDRSLLRRLARLCFSASRSRRTAP